MNPLMNRDQMQLDVLFAITYIRLLAKAEVSIFITAYKT